MRSPLWRYQTTGVAFKGWGVGTDRSALLTEDWPWCPRWFWAFDPAQLNGKHPLDAFMELRRLRDTGMLPHVYPPPWTEAMVDGLLLADTLEVIREAERAAEQADQARRAAAEAAAKAKSQAGR